MGGKVALALLVICLGASALIAEARTHKSFSASTYYESNETVTTIVPKNEPTKTTNDPAERYPNGYPGGKHVWNPLTEKYESVNETGAQPQGRYPNGYPSRSHVYNPATEKYESVNETHTASLNRYPNGYPGSTHHYNAVTQKYDEVTNQSERYPHGYYGKSTFDFKEGDTLTTVKSTGNYTAETKSNETNVEGTQNRYPTGYYGKSTFDYKEGDTLTTVKSNGNYTEEAKSNETNVEGTQNRYPHGYYGKSTFDYKEGDTLTTVKSSGKYTEETKGQEGTQNRYPAGYNKGHNANPTTVAQYTSVSQPDAKTFDPLNRYPHGYYGKATSYSSQVSNPQTTATATVSERYPHGYYPDSEYTKQSVSPPKPVTYASSTGNFNTLPYPSSGVPFVPNGGGCRTAYWADHVNAWPSFLKATSTVGDAFGTKATEVYGQTTILDALLKYGSDPFSELLRAACTALLNSYTRGEFAISHMKVIEQFDAALVSKAAATAQALVFETENVVSISAGNACT